MRIGSGDESVIALYDFGHMGLRAVLQDQPLQGVRAGLPLALAAKYLAASAASAVGCIGAGPAAEAAVLSLARLRQIRTIAVRGRDDARGEALARRLAAELSGARVKPVQSAAEAVRAMDIVLIAPEASGRGRLQDAWVRPGQFIATTDPDAIPPATRARATAIHATRKHAPAWAAGAGRVIELGDIIGGRHRGRTCDDEIVIFISPPDIGFYDVATAWWRYQIARAHGLGVEIPLASSEPLEAAASL